jgi:Abnormal spindle-like microcephaly-assoc'd, ASPM-SPD-2-Hydin
MQQLGRSGSSTKWNHVHRFLWPLVLLVAAAVVLLVPAAGQAGAAPALAWSPATNGGYDFGALEAGKTESKTFTLTNSSGSATAELTISLSGSSAVTVTGDKCTGRSLGPKKSCTVSVRFAPAEGGSAQATVTATAGKAKASLTLTGKGEASSADISLSPFSGLNDNVRVTNSGPSAATVTVILVCSGGFGMGDDFPGEWDGAFGPPGDHWKTSKDPIPSGGSLTFMARCLAPGGYVEVYSSTQPDPDSTPNNAVTTEDDYLGIS